MGEDNDEFGTGTGVSGDGREYIIVPWDPRMSAGAGYDSISQAVLPGPFEKMMNNQEKPVDDGQKNTLKVRQVQQVKEISTQIAAQAGLKVGYDVFSSEAVGTFLRESRINTFSLYFMVLAYAQRSLVEYMGLKLRDKALELTANPKDFRRKYGDYYVAGYYAGGYVIGLAELRVNSEQVFNQVTSKVKGKYDALVTVDATVQGHWQSLEKTAGSDFSLQVIHAGVGEGIKAYASGVVHNAPGNGGGTTGGAARLATPGVAVWSGIAQPEEDRAEDSRTEARERDTRERDTTDAKAIVGEGIPKDQIKAWPDGGGDDDDDDDDDTAGPPKAMLAAVAKLPVTKPRSRGGDTTPGPTPPKTEPAPLIKPHLNDPDSGDYIPALEMNLQGMMNTATAVQAQSDKKRIKLLALLAPYSSLDDGPKNSGDLVDITLAEFNRKRVTLAEYYSDACQLRDTLRHAQDNQGEFTTPGGGDLTKLIQKVDASIISYIDTWEKLKANPMLSLEGITPPDKSEMPRWAVKRSAFSPVGEAVDPELFVDELDKAIKVALAEPDAAKRQALKDYLALVLKASIENYGSVQLALENLAEAFLELNDESTRLGREVLLLATSAERGKKAWNLASNALDKKFKGLTGQAGLEEKQLKFLKTLNQIVFGAAAVEDEQRHGFRAFWDKLHQELRDLADKASMPGRKLTELVDFNVDDWSALATKFEASNRVLGVAIQQKLT